MMCHDGMIEYLFLDEDIQQLTSAGADGYIRFWNLDVLKSLALIILINTSSSSPPSSSLGAKKQREKNGLFQLKSQERRIP
jgi:WD40 repeat protein